MLSGVTFDPTEHFFSQQEYINHNEMIILPKSQDRMGLELHEILLLSYTSLISDAESKLLGVNLTPFLLNRVLK